MLKKNSQDATHVSKNSISRQKNPCKFFFSHNQNPHDQKLLPTKNHAPKKVNAPPKISSQSKCFTYPYTTTKSFFHNHAQKFLHDQDSQQIISYLSMHNKYILTAKIITTKIFHEPTSHAQQYFSISQSFMLTKFVHTHKFIHAYTHKILPCS